MCSKLEIESQTAGADGRASDDRPGDPLFPLMPGVLEALRSRHAEAMSADTMEAADGLSADDYAVMIESICGATDDSQPVEQYNGTLGVTRAFVDSHQRAVGQIQWNDNLASIYTNPGNVNGARWCTGTMITNDLFLTAGHCFDQTGGGWQRPRVNGTSNIISSAEIAQNMHVNFNFQVDPAGNQRPETRFAITQLIEYRLNGLDFAIIRLSGNPGATWGRATIATADATAGQMLCIIGHPAGLPKRIEAGPALAPSGNLIRYDDIDTLGGNSGSGVLRASDGRLVGVHTNGGCNTSSPDGTNANFGQRIAALIAASPTLQSLTRPSVKFTDDIGTSIARDLQTTLKGSDDINTIRATDQIGTVRAADTVGTIRALDIGGSLKFRDDVKIPALDNPNFDPAGPVINPDPGFARPFVLANPHHTMAWAGQEMQTADEAAQAQEATLEQMMEIIAQHEAALETLHEHYAALAGAQAQQLGAGGDDGSRG